ncbi:hypothetical protein [Sulfuricurvum sp.]|uniref:hypothetical protein n=1 Tax=Sulfuricurvum sp. TaxID=2025608 RepID=UPI0035628900
MSSKKAMSWIEVELDVPNRVIEVNVEDLGFKSINERGEEVPLKTLNVKDLSNDDVMMLQIDPDLERVSGFINDASTPKGQMFGILLTYRRMLKGNPNLEFTEKQFRKFSTTRTGQLAKRINEAITNTQKKLENSPSQMKDNSSPK